MEGDLKPLEGELEDFLRLRVGSYRVILQFISDARGPVIRCVSAEAASGGVLTFRRAAARELNTTPEMYLLALPV
jgi:hypothetical protein